MTITRDFTATTFIVLHDRTLLLHHRKLAIWVPPGGHIDLNELPHIAALREVWEETGLQAELLRAPQSLGNIEVLPQPECILLEDITPGHQHIDLIYFARVIGGDLLPAERETLAAHWYSWEELANPEIAEDMRVLGRRAIEAVRARVAAGSEGK